MKESRFYKCACLALKKKKTGGGVGGEGAAPPPQSSMNIAILTCIAITWICIGMRVIKSTWRIVDVQMGMFDRGERAHV